MERRAPGEGMSLSSWGELQGEGAEEAAGAGGAGQGEGEAWGTWMALEHAETSLK